MKRGRSRGRGGNGDLIAETADLPASRGKLVEYPLNSRLFYAFDLKIAHHESELPAAKVRPQTVSGQNRRDDVNVVWF